MPRLNVIALLGKSKSGKDTFGRMLVEASGRIGLTIAFADKLKQVFADVFDVPLEELYADAGKAASMGLPCLVCPLCKSISCELVTIDRDLLASCKACGSIGERQGFATEWTRRMGLQHVGTEGFRAVDDAVWVKHALKAAAGHLAKATRGNDGPQGGMAFVAITDCRFRSEMDAVLAAGGEVWRIRRPETDERKVGIGGHASETEMDSIPDHMFQRIIVNDGTLDQLQAKAMAGISRFLRRDVRESLSDETSGETTVDLG